MSFRQDVADLFDRHLQRTSSIGELPGISRLLRTARSEVDSPMRVAIVGRIKAGKSTMMNALLGEHLVPTGAAEMTFNVNWFRFSEEPYLKIVFRDGREEQAKLSDLYAVTARDGSPAEYLRKIRYVEIGHPNPILKKLDILDTPGLQSIHVDDSNNTLDTLGLSHAEISSWSGEAATSADAIVYLFSKSLSLSDVELLRQFRGNLQSMSPANSVGVLTRVDDYFPMEDPFVAGHRVVQAHRERHPELDRLFYTVHPISGMLALGALTLDESNVLTLRTLAEIPGEVLDQHVWSRDAEAFRTRAFANIPAMPSVEQRAALWSKVGYYGCYVLVGCFRQRLSEQELRNHAMEISGVLFLRRLLVEHFGGRALGIKLCRRMQELISFRFTDEYRHASTPAKQTIERIVEDCAAFLARNRFAREFEILQQYYDGRFACTEEENAWLRQLIGENGQKAYQRLGLPSEVPLPELKRNASLRLSAIQERKQFAPFAGEDREEALQALEDLIAHLLSNISAAEALVDREL